MERKRAATIGGLLLCGLFFVAPLVQCSQDSSLSATGLEIATGTGKLMGHAETSYPAVFLLLIAPIILTLLSFANKSFAVLRNASIAGLAAQIIFLIAAYAMLNSGDYDGAFVLTPLNWLIVAIYIGLIGFMHYCNTQEATIKIVPVIKNMDTNVQPSSDSRKSADTESHGPVVNCSKCGTVNPATNTNCYSCGTAIKATESA